MNREQSIEAIKVMQAWLDGEEVEGMEKDGHPWKNIYRTPTWDWARCEYRIKPKPMRKYVVILANGKSDTFDSQHEAISSWHSDFIKWHGWMVEEPK